ncbi:DNA binding domain-containing protein, excisionase family [Chitinophaga sp. YR627]|uniref:helix-turn-helix domain-containing protein n=1 Tax=Chitinophaga sp. YR627 TaxID=1881041 RepID=UPI0008EA4F3B|nr:helix-turn-helix domain-containing protein [Chitinophaga sp. YR627]SFO36030.1 DNA binding domain-containing protein, excisionase family [Chitinophaga sp. YR627]
MEAILEKTTRTDQEIARAIRPKVSEVSTEIAKNESDKVSLKIAGYEEELEIPKSAILLFFTILDKMAEGNSFALFHSDNNTDISTQQAAEMLGVSRPHIVNLLEKGEIPFHKVGTHRRIQLKDLIAYDKKMKKKRADNLDFLAGQAQDLNLGY